MTDLLKFEQINFNYPGGPPVLKDLSFQVNKGETLAFLGPNGSGKSTSIKCGLGILAPHSGSVQLFGGAPVDPEMRKKLGYVPQYSEFPEQVRVSDLIELCAGHYENTGNIDLVTEAFGIKKCWKRNANNLSGGQKRCVSLALAFIGEPDLVVLDEPSVGIDVEMRERLQQYLKLYSQQGGAVLLTTHYIEEAEQLSDRVILLNKGRIVREGSVKEIRDSLGLSRIRFFIEGELPELSALEIRRHGDLVELLTDRPDETVKKIVSQIPFKNLEVESASLEEAIRGIIGEARE